jgi:ABC-2 type transport system permease protein
LLAPTWGVQAIREAAMGGTPWPDIGMTVALGLAYLAIGAVCLRHFETAARRHATLSLT